MAVQKERIGRIKRVSFVAIFSLIIFGGCATKEAIKGVSDEEVLRERVTAYWDLRVKQELDKTYQFEYPLYRKQVTLVKYVKRYSTPMISYNAFEILDIAMREEDAAEVKVKVRQRLKMPGAKPFEHDMNLLDHWVKIDEAWYHVIKKSAENLAHEKEKGGDVTD